jgi:hypothetical protein
MAGSRCDEPLRLRHSPIMSLPAMMAGRACRWIAKGFSILYFSSTWRIRVLRPVWSHVSIGAGHPAQADRQEGARD